MEERFPTNYSVLLAGPPGVGKFEYLISRIREDLRLGERVVFVTLDMPPNEIRARAKALHLDLGAHEGKSFVFVDCYSATSSDRPEAAPGKKTFLVHHMRGYQVDAAWHPFRQLPEAVVSL